MDPFDSWLAVTRVSGGAGPAVYRAVDNTRGNGATTAAIGFRALEAELRHQKSRCSEPMTFNIEMLSGMELGEEIEIEVDILRSGAKFAFVRAVMRAIGKPGAQNRKVSNVANISAVFYNPERAGKVPPFPAPPMDKKPPPFESFVSMRETIASFRKPNFLKESWDWKVRPEFAAKLKDLDSAAKREGWDVATFRRKVSEWATTKEAEQDAWYNCELLSLSPTSHPKANMERIQDHSSGRPCDAVSCILFNDFFTPQGYINLFVGDTHEKDGFPLLSIVFTLNFTAPIRPDKARGLWCRYKYKGDFGDLEEREMVLRDEEGKAVCVGRQVIMWRRPLCKGEKL